MQVILVFTFQIPSYGIFTKRLPVIEYFIILLLLYLLPYLSQLLFLIHFLVVSGKDHTGELKSCERCSVKKVRIIQRDAMCSSVISGNSLIQLITKLYYQFYAGRYGMLIRCGYLRILLIVTLAEPQIYLTEEVCRLET